MLLAGSGLARAAEIQNLRIWAGPEYTRDLFHVSGQADFLIHIAVADSTHLQAFLMDNDAYRVRLCTHLLHRLRRDEIGAPDAPDGGSVWLEKVGERS